MISEEQKELSEYIKNVHLSLRCKSRQLGAETAWKEHVKDEKILKKYSACMKKLAEKYWSVNNKKNSEKYLCRIEWMVNTVTEYFQNDLITQISKENKKMKFSADEIWNLKDFNKPLKLLDVGSCYDPFSTCQIFRTFPIDLCPAKSTVKKCDFTRLSVDNSISYDSLEWFRDNLESIPPDFFDVVVFSLFLEYLPSPEQRLISCKLAYDSLKINGLLLIATPDSKHASANAGIMKNWKFALGQLGFVRIKLEKLKYLYCMAFRKAISKQYPRVLYKLSDFDVGVEIKIPQDFIDYEVEQHLHSHSYKDEESNIKNTFQELPFPDLSPF